jgi:hypothetical protein
MNARSALIVVAAILAVAPVVRGGHELPVYPSYYPHEIEIAVLTPEDAVAALRADKLHAYIGSSPPLDVSPSDTIGSVASLGSFVIVRINSGSQLAGDDASACALAAAIVRDMAARSGELVAHPYPVTPLHGDYLYHADLAEAAGARLAGGTGVAGPAEREPRVKVEGPTAQRLVRPEWRVQGGPWDAIVTEIDARNLVASASDAVNGWLGPRWTRSGWFHAHRLLAQSIAEPERRQRVDAELKRLQAGYFEGTVERINAERDLVRSLTASCRTVVAGYTIRREYINTGFSTGIENIAYDALEGLSSPMFLRTVKLKDFPWNGWLQLATAAGADAAWNPIGGFTGDFGRLMWFAVGDPAAVPSPYDHAWILNRISEVDSVPRR